jgi:hypothetical protein
VSSLKGDDEHFGPSYSGFAGPLRRESMFEEIRNKFLWWNPPFHASEVYPNLFQGSQISSPEDITRVMRLEIRVVIDLEGGFDPPMGFLNSYLFWPILDLPVLPNLKILECVASFGWGTLIGESKVLVHCRQGLNRSGLVCAKIMSRFNLKGPDILKAINEKIPGALWNPVFREYVRGL